MNAPQQALKDKLPDGLADVRTAGRILRLMQEMAAAARRSERKV